MPLIAVNNSKYTELSQFMEKGMEYVFTDARDVSFVFAATRPPIANAGVTYGKYKTLIFDGDLKIYGKSATVNGNINVYKKHEDLEMDPAGSPSFFAKGTASGNTFLIQKGQLNKLRLRPQIINEHAESSREIIATVSSGNSVGQIFKASRDNINGIDLALESASIDVFDNFESYANDTALQTAWPLTGSTGDAVLNTLLVDPASSTQSMELISEATSLNNEWTKTITATDYTGVTGSISFRCTKSYNDVKMRLFIGDGTNTKSAPIVQGTNDIWQKIEISVDQMTEDGGGTTNTTQITKVGFRLTAGKNDGICYIDTMVSSPPPGSVEIKIFDMGDTLPVSGVTGLDDGTQYEKIGDIGISGAQESSIILDMDGGFRTYHVNSFVCGVALEIPDNEVLTPNNYYAIVLNYIDTDVSVYGPNAAWEDYYNNGYSFTTPDEVSAITATGANEDISFVIYSTQDVYMNGFQNFIDAAPNGNATASFYIEDSEMKRSTIFIVGIKPPQNSIQDFSNPSLLEKGGKVELEYNDDFTDNVTKATLIILYNYMQEDING